jgi:hypothetical protein
MLSAGYAGLNTDLSSLSDSFEIKMPCLRYGVWVLWPVGSNALTIIIKQIIYAITN